MSEFERLVRLDELGAGPRKLAIEADAAERAALATRFGLVGIAVLAADVALVRAGDKVTLTGQMRAEVTQSCVITDAPLRARIDEPLSLHFEPGGVAAEDEIELGEADLDVVLYEGSAVDVGEAVAQSLILALDPFPRAANADAVGAGILSEEEAKPESPLAAALKAKLTR